jgi:hypothetical protein
MATFHLDELGPAVIPNRSFYLDNTGNAHGPGNLRIEWRPLIDNFPLAVDRMVGSMDADGRRHRGQSE